MYTEDNRDFDDNYDDNYENNNDSFHYTKLIIKILIIAICVIIVIWLIYKLIGLSKNNIKNDGTVFNNNVKTIKSASEKYFFEDNNLPQNVDDTLTITLGELTSLGRVDTIRDYKNRACSTNRDASYSKLLKTKTYYELKVKLTCDEETKEYTYYYNLQEEDKNDEDEEIRNLNINCNNWSDWTDKKLSDSSLLVRTRTLVKGYKVVGTETTTYGPWSEWSTTVATPSDTLEVESKEETIVAWSANKETTDKISNSDTIRIIDTKTTEGDYTCYNKKVEEKVTADVTYEEYYDLLDKGLVVSLNNTYWKKANGQYVNVYNVTYKKVTTKKVCSRSKITTYT